MAGARRIHRLSVCVITRNEEENLRDCLESVRWADEIVVVDSRSTDRTAAIARELADRVVLRDFAGHIEQKNFCLDEASHEWVLCLDADERVPPALRAEIEELLSRPDPGADGYSIPRRTYHLGRWVRHGGWSPDAKLRLFRRSRGRWGGENPHDRVVLDGRAGRLRAPMLHFTYRDLGQHLERIDLFSGIAARAKQEKGVRFAGLRMVLHPPAKFLKAYLLRGGFRDGLAGAVLAVMAAYAVFLKYAKLRELRQISPGGRE